jgi:hypothetical protein
MATPGWWTPMATGPWGRRRPLAEAVGAVQRRAPAGAAPAASPTGFAGTRMATPGLVAADGRRPKWAAGAVQDLGT